MINRITPPAGHAVSSSIVRAVQLAVWAHNSVRQTRRYTGEPYWVHPAAVAARVARVPLHTPDMIAAAWLHDVVEDTPVDMGDIHRLFGSSVAALVDDLTDVSRPGDGNRRTRKQIDLEHTAQASDAAKTIKLADLIDNAQSIFRYDPKFAPVYAREMRNLLPVLLTGDSALHKQATGILQDFFSAVA